MNPTPIIHNLISRFSRLLFVVFFISLFLCANHVFATSNFNQEINYQGKLTDSTNATVLDGDYNFTFNIYDQSNALVWTETRTAANRVSVRNGLFSVMLGEVTPLSGIDWNQTLTLGINVGGSGLVPIWDGEMSPRKSFGSVPASLLSANSDKFGGLATSSFVRTDTNSTISLTSASTALTITQSGVGNIADFKNGGSTIFSVSGSGVTAASLTVGSLNGLVFATNGSVGTVATSSLGLPQFSDLNTYLSLSSWNATTTNALAEGLNHLYYTDTRAREALTVSATGLSYASSTGLISLSSGYVIPVSASTTAWNNVTNTVTASSTNWTSAYNTVAASSSKWDQSFAWGNHALAGYLTNLTGGLNAILSNSTTTNATTTGRLAVTGTSTFATTTISKLTVTGDTQLSGALITSGGSAGSNGWLLQSTGTGWQWIATSSLGLNATGTTQWTTAGSNIYFATGNVGIGSTTNPYNLLTVSAATTSSTTAKVALFSTDQMQLSQLEGGAYFGRVGLKENQWGVNNYGNTWAATLTTTSNGWAVAVSSDGKLQTADIGGYLYTSSDYGQSWTSRYHSSSQTSNIAMSSDGKFQTAAGLYRYLYVSSDYGNTWAIKSPISTWSGIAMSSDGKFQVATNGYSGTDGYIYLSSDYGNTWATTSSARRWNDVAMSSDGRIQTAVAGSSGVPDYVYISSDYGATWTAKDSARDWSSVAMSADGKIQVAGAGSGVYISTDYGAAWTNKQAIGLVYGLAMSSDGKVMAAGILNGNIYISNDYGATWSAKDSSRRWYSLAMSSDGKVMAAADYDSYIYESYANSYQYGRLAIGTSTAGTYNLSIVGDVNLSGSIYKNGVAYYNASQWTATGTQIYYNTDNVGIGNTSPTYKLDVNSTIGNSTSTLNFLSGAGLVNIGSGAGFSMNTNSQIMGGVFGSGGHINLVGGQNSTPTGGNGSPWLGDNTWGGFIFLGGSARLDSHNRYVQMGANNNAILTLKGSVGYVGIGDTNPAQGLSIIGNTNLGSTISLSNSSTTGVASMAATLNSAEGLFRSYGTSFANASLAGRTGFGPSGGSDAHGIVILSNSTSGSGSTGSISLRGGGYDSAAEKLYIDKNGSYFTGNVGIGTQNPYNLLTVTAATTSSTTAKVALFSIDQMQLSQLEGGAYFGRVGITENQWGLNNYGETWTAKGASTSWSGIAMSSDGKIQTATVNSGNIYISIDYGQTWTAKGTSTSWSGVAMSSDGKIQTAVVNAGNIYISSDYGATWTAKDSSRAWLKVAMSSDGKIQTAVADSDNIYISSDYGATWAAKGLSGSWSDVAMSSDGKIQTAVNGQVYTSNDYGDTWEEEDPTVNARNVAMSSDGKVQTVVFSFGGFGANLYISNDYGHSWVIKDSARKWIGVAMSSDGKIQTAVVFNGNLYLSTDYGATWTAKDSSRTWEAVAMSSDGKIQTAAADTSSSDNLYVSYASSYQYGSVAIGTSTPGTYKLYVDGTGYLNSSAWTYGSDRRMKENITYFDETNVDALDILGKLRPASFDYINGEKNAQGFIAQDLQEVLPNLVTTQENGMLGIKTTNLIPYLVRGIQELVTNFNSVVDHVADGVAYLKNIAVEHLAAGSLSNPIGVTMYDTITQKPYCLKIVNREMAAVAGVCENNIPVAATTTE